jgi:uncharacterized protein (DUF2141 family)
MKRLIRWGIVVIAVAGPGSAQLTASRGEITVLLHSFRTDAGQALVALFKGEEGFPDDFTRAYKTATVEIKNYEGRATFTDLPYSTYAVAVIHDENGNGVMDINFFKVPIEGTGASHDAGDALNPPEYRDAMLDLNTAQLTIHINLRY